MRSTKATDAARLMSALTDALEPSGFDVLGAVDADAYNESLTELQRAYRLPKLGEERALVVVVGNTRRLWPLFMTHCAALGPNLGAHPLDTYSRAHIDAAAAAVARGFGIAHAVRYSFDQAPHAVAIQRLAVLAGVAEMSPIGLCVHEIYGPWLSLRAAIVLATQGPARSHASPTCSACVDRPCVAARTRLLGSPDADLMQPNLALPWQGWLAMRDACPVGRAARYDDSQIRYHYTKDLRVLDVDSPGLFGSRAHEDAPVAPPSVLP